MDKTNFENLVKNIESILLNKDVNVVDIAFLCLSSMKFVESIKELKGSEKKQLVIDAITHVFKIKEWNTDMLIILPSLIETIISVDKGIYKINKDGCCCF